MPGSTKWEMNPSRSLSSKQLLDIEYEDSNINCDVIGYSVAQRKGEYVIMIHSGNILCHSETKMEVRKKYYIKFHSLYYNWKKQHSNNNTNLRPTATYCADEEELLTAEITK